MAAGTTSCGAGIIFLPNQSIQSWSRHIERQTDENISTESHLSTNELSDTRTTWTSHQTHTYVQTDTRRSPQTNGSFQISRFAHDGQLQNSSIGQSLCNPERRLSRGAISAVLRDPWPGTERSLQTGHTIFLSVKHYTDTSMLGQLYMVGYWTSQTIN